MVGLSNDERLRVRSALKNLTTERFLHGAAAAVDSAEDGSEGGSGAREGEGVVEETEASEVVEGPGDRTRRRGRPVALTAPIGGLDHFAGWLEERRREVGSITLENGVTFVVGSREPEASHVIRSFCCFTLFDTSSRPVSQAHHVTCVPPFVLEFVNVCSDIICPLDYVVVFCSSLVRCHIA